RHLYDAVGGTYLQQENFLCSNSRWREISGSKYGTQMRRQLMSQNKDLQKKLHNTPSPKCSTLADYGKRHLYDAVGGTYLQQENFLCSNSRWREISGSKYGTQMPRQWMSQNKDLQKKLHDTPTPKCSTLADYGKYLGFFLSERDNILGFFREPKWRRLRFITRRKRQKAYDILAKELTGGRSLRLFSLVPLAAYQQTHIPLDSCAFHQILVPSGLAKEFGCNKLEDFLLDPRKYWAMVFNLNSVETINRRFACRVVTNGVKIGINMLKPKIEYNFNEWGLDNNNNYHPINITAETRVVALDPGRRHLYDAVGGTYLQQENFLCSNSRWREISGSKYGTQMPRQWMSQNKDLQKKLHNTPTPKSSTQADYGKYLEFFLSERDNILGFFREPKWRRLRFITRKKRQKAYDILAKELTGELTGGDPNCVIAYGAGKFDCSSRGHAPTPNRKLFTELRKSQICANCNHLLDKVYRKTTKMKPGKTESNIKHMEQAKKNSKKLCWGLKKCNNHLASTSQICANCNHLLDKVYRKTTKMKPGKTESNIKNIEQAKKNSKKLCWGLKKCNNHLASVRGRSYCLTLWDRDINAALNIRHVFLYRNANKNESPGIFKRKKESDDDETKKDDQNSTQPQVASPVAPIDMARGS
ncbi:hypothetical protein MP638_000225, partial [Amoeboaphelidium occidentale]